jgi:hypothetical protein
MGLGDGGGTGTGGLWVEGRMSEMLRRGCHNQQLGTRAQAGK